jgi:hypothetical protein
VRRLLVLVGLLAFVGAAPSSARPATIVPFKKVAAGLSEYGVPLSEALGSGFIAGTRAATKPFLWLLRPRDQATVKGVDFKRWAVIAVFEQESACSGMKIDGAARDGWVARVAVSLVLPPPDGTCVANASPYQAYEVIKVRKAPMFHPLPPVVQLEWFTPPPVTGFVGTQPFSLAPGAWCWSWLTIGNCTDASRSALVPLGPTILVSDSGSVGFLFRFVPDKVTLTLLDPSGAPTETDQLPPSCRIFVSFACATWNVPAAFSTRSDGVATVVEARSDQGSVDYFVRFVSSRPNLARPPGVAPVGGGIP